MTLRAAAHRLDDVGGATGRYAVDETRRCYVYEMRDGRRPSDPRAARRGRTARPGGRRDPAAREHHGRPGRGPAGADDARPRPTSSRSIWSTTAAARRRSWSRSVADSRPARARPRTPDGITRTGCGRSPTRRTHAAIADDLAGRRALIADGHHRYATYRELQRGCAQSGGAGPVGPRADAARRLDRATARRCMRSIGSSPRWRSPTRSLGSRRPGRRLRHADGRRAVTGRTARTIAGFAAVLTDGDAVAVVADDQGRLRAAAAGDGRSGRTRRRWT